MRTCFSFGRATFAVAALLVSALLVSLPLAGCGGGGGGSTSQNGVISGRVFVPTGRAGRAPVTIGVDGTNLSTVAGADGKFSISGVPAGLQTIFCKSDKGAIAVVATVTPGGETKLGDLELADAGQISGLITTAAEGRTVPVEGARVAVSPVAPENADLLPFPVRTTRTGPSGSYSVDGLPIGHYMVSVRAKGYEAASAITEVTVGHTSAVDVTLTASPAAGAGSMTGTVFLKLDDGSTQPLAGVLVRLAETSDPEPLRPMPDELTAPGGGTVSTNASRMHPGNDHDHDHEHYTFTDDQGQYTLSGVPAGTYNAVAVRHGLTPDRGPVTIVAGETLTHDFTLTLRKNNAAIVVGTVTDAATHQPIANAQVSIWFEVPPPYDVVVGGGVVSVSPGKEGHENGSLFFGPDEYILYAETDAQGKYKLLIPGGEHKISAWAEGYISGQAGVTAKPGQQTTVDIALDKDPGVVTVTGKTVRKSSDGNMVPVAKAEVWAAYWWNGDPGVMKAGGGSSSSDGNGTTMPVQVFNTTSDDSGNFTLQLHAGPYSFAAHAEGLFTRDLKVDVTANTPPVTLVLEPEK